MTKTGRNLSGQEARWERICSAHMMSAQYDREMCLQHSYGWLASSEVSVWTEITMNKARSCITKKSVCHQVKKENHGKSTSFEHKASHLSSALQENHTNIIKNYSP